MHFSRMRTDRLLTVCLLTVCLCVYVCVCASTGTGVHPPVGDASTGRICIHWYEVYPLAGGASTGGGASGGASMGSASTGCIHRGWGCIQRVHPGGGCIHGGASWMHPPPVDRMTDTCENITFSILRMRSVMIPAKLLVHVKMGSVKQQYSVGRKLNLSRHSFFLQLEPKFIPTKSCISPDMSCFYFILHLYLKILGTVVCDIFYHHHLLGILTRNLELKTDKLNMIS